MSKCTHELRHLYSINPFITHLLGPLISLPNSLLGFFPNLKDLITSLDPCMVDVPIQEYFHSNLGSSYLGKVQGRPKKIRAITKVREASVRVEASSFCPYHSKARAFSNSQLNFQVTKEVSLYMSLSYPLASLLGIVKGLGNSLTIFHLKSLIEIVTPLT